MRCLCERTNNGRRETAVGVRKQNVKDAAVCLICAAAHYGLFYPKR